LIDLQVMVDLFKGLEFEEHIKKAGEQA